MLLNKDQHPVRALAAHGADQAFRSRTPRIAPVAPVRPTMRRRTDLPSLCKPLTTHSIGKIVQRLAAKLGCHCHCAHHHIFASHKAHPLTLFFYKKYYTVEYLDV